MDMESLLLGLVNTNLTKKALASSAKVQREDRSVPNSTRRAFESQMRADAAVSRVAAQNMDDAKAMVNVAQTGATAIKSQLQEIQKILTDFAKIDGIATADVLAETNAAITEHITEIQRLAQNTSFNGMNLMDGSAGMHQDGTVVLQAGRTGDVSSQRDQHFTNLLDTTLTGTTVLGTNSMNVANLADGLFDQSGGVLTSQANAARALDTIATYIERMEGLENRYAYDYKALDNLGILFEEQADIFENASAYHAAQSTSTASAATPSTRQDYLQQILASLGNTTIFSNIT